MTVAILQALVLVFIAATGAGVALTRDPLRQSIAVGFHGLLLSILFFLLQAPDVALSQIAVGAVALPLMMLLAIRKTRSDAVERRRNG